MNQATRAVAREQVVAAFNAWLETRGDKLSEAQTTLCADALEELVELRTPLFDEWYVRNHYRYRALREDERRPARASCRFFIAQICMGKIDL